MNPNRLRAGALAFLLLAFPCIPTPVAAAETPTATVARLNDALIETMKNAAGLGYKGRYEKLAPVLKQVFDFPAMAKVAIGSTWSSISSAQQQAFTEAFTEYSIGVFAYRFDGYSGEKFEILGEQPARRGTVLVQNQIVKSDGEPVAINYLARSVDGGKDWRLVDTVLGGAISELATRRDEYSGIIRKLGINALIERLKDKTAGFAAN